MGRQSARRTGLPRIPPREVSSRHGSHQHSSEAIGGEYVILSARIGQQKVADLAFSIVSFHEQVLGCHTYISRARNSIALVRAYDMLERILGAFAVANLLPFDVAAASVFDRLFAQRIRLATMDLRIAAIALSQGLVLLTRNVRDFGKVPGLITEDWTT